jgi:hypothetical protein
VTTAILLAVLVLVDCTLAGFRAAAGRDGRLEKRDYYGREVLRAAGFGALLLLAHVALAGALVATAADPSAAWAELVLAARLPVVVYGIFATTIFLAFGFYFAPIGDFRVLANVLVFGPLTLVRRPVIVLGMALAVLRVPSARVAVLAAVAAISMCLFEGLVGRRNTKRWKDLVV